MGAVLAALVRGALAAEMDFGLDLRERERNGVRIAVERESVDPGTSGIAEAEQLGDFVVGFAGSVVEGAADEGVMPGAVRGAGEIEMGVAAGDDQSQGCAVGSRAACPAVHDSGPTHLWLRRFAFLSRTAWMWPSRWLTAMSGRLLGEGQGLGVGDADEQRAGEAGAGGDGDGVEIGEGDAGLGQRGADDGNDGAQVLAAGQLGHDAAVAGVGGDLRGDDARRACGRRARPRLRRSRRRRIQCRG